MKVKGAAVVRRPLCGRLPSLIHRVWIKDQSVEIDKGKIVGYKVSLKVTFVLSE